MKLIELYQLQRTVIVMSRLKGDDVAISGTQLLLLRNDGAVVGCVDFNRAIRGNIERSGRYGTFGS